MSSAATSTSSGPTAAAGPTPRDLLAYGLPGSGLEAVTLLSSLYVVKFATEALWIAPAVVGAIFGASRVWDAVSDPMIGYASDRTRSRFGRRRPWMLCGAPLLALSFYALWCGVGEAGSGVRVAAFAAAAIGFYSALTLVSVPHASLGASIASTLGARNRIFASRALFKNLGIVIALVAVSQLDAAAASGELALHAPRTALWVAAAAASMIMLGAGLSREPQTTHVPPKSSVRALRGIAAQTSARRILAVLGLQEFAIGALLVTLPFASEHLLGMAGQTAWILVAFVVPLTLALPVWVRIASHLGTMRTWRAGNAIEALGFLPLFFVGEGQTFVVAASAGCIGIGHAAGRILIMTALATSADEDARRSGEAKEGLFYAASTFTEKCAAGLAAFGVGVALQAAGFVAGTALPESVLWVLRMSVSLVPALMTGLSCVVLTRAIERPSLQPSDEPLCPAPLRS